MTDVPPPEQPGWYQDAHGAWWWWDGRSWTDGRLAASVGVGGAGASAPPAEKGTALAVWLVYLLVGCGFIGPLVFYFAVKDKRFVRHHAAQATNLGLTVLILQLPAIALVGPWYWDLLQSDVDGVSAPSPTAATWVGFALLGATTLLHYGVGIWGAIRAYRGSWRRVPVLPLVRGAVRAGEEPYVVER